MRCPHCAGEIPAGSRFCGICGRGITPAVGGAHAAVEGVRWPATPSPFAPSAEAQADSISLFEMPASRPARRARLALILVLDAILAGAGVVMLMAYFDARGDTRSSVTPADLGDRPEGAGPSETQTAAPGRDAGATGESPSGAAVPDAGSPSGGVRPGGAAGAVKPRPRGSQPATPPVRRPKPKRPAAPKTQPTIPPDDGSRIDARRDVRPADPHGAKLAAAAPA